MLPLHHASGHDQAAAAGHPGPGVGSRAGLESKIQGYPVTLEE